jgi:hypothetical protein
MALELETVRSNSRYCPQSVMRVIQKWFMYELISEQDGPANADQGVDQTPQKLSRFEYFFFHH